MKILGVQSVVLGARAQVPGAFMAAAALLLVTACGTGDAAPAGSAATTEATPPASQTEIPEGTPSPSTPAPTSAPSSEGADNDAAGEASTHLLTEEELPDGWRHATGEQHLGRPVACGVVLEPKKMESYDTIRYTQGFSGPFIVQYSFLAVDEDNAMATADRLAEEADTCESFELEGRTITVEPLSGVPAVGEGFSALRLTANDTARDTVTFRVGRHVTVLVGYSPATMPEASDLSSIAATVAAKVEAGG